MTTEELRSLRPGDTINYHSRYRGFCFRAVVVEAGYSAVLVKFTEGGWGWTRDGSLLIPSHKLTEDTYQIPREFRK